MAKAKAPETLVFTGSYVDGLRDAGGKLIGLATWARLDLTEEQSDLLCESISELKIIEQCQHAIIEEEEHDSDMPGQSDVFIEVRTHDVDALRREVTKIIMSIIEED
jgi:hypothetical protein